MSPMDDVQRKQIAACLQALYATKYVRDDNVPCKIEEGLFLGSVGVATKKEALKSLNIKHILIVAKSLEPAFPNDFVYKKIEVLDTPATNLREHFDECFDFIDGARQAGFGVLVHCFAGKSRSVTIIIAYLMKKHHMSLSQAFSLVKSKRPQIAPNIGFVSQLKNYEKSLGGPVEDIEASTAEHIGASTAGHIGATTVEQQEETTSEEEWEWHYNKEAEEFFLKKNNRYRFIPEMDSSGVPLLLPSLLKHPEDDKLLNNMTDYEVGVLQTHISMTSMILGQCLTERVMKTNQELSDCRAEITELQEIASLHKELARRYKNESETLGSTVQSQDADHKEVVAAFEAKEATATEELKKAKAEVERLQQLHKASEETLYAERKAAAADKEALQAKVIELEEAMAQMNKSQVKDTASMQDLIEEYKETDEHQYELKEVGLYGFNLLKRVLAHEKKLSTAELNVYDYDNCILEDADGNIPP